MPSVELPGRGTGASAPARRDDFDRLREAFYARLRYDRVQLAVFAAALTSAEVDAAQMFEGLRRLAHKTRGMSGFFHFLKAAEAATSLEHATERALSIHAERSDPTVWAALVQLMDVLAGVAAD